MPAPKSFEKWRKKLRSEFGKYVQMSTLTPKAANVEAIRMLGESLGRTVSLYGHLPGDYQTFLSLPSNNDPLKRRVSIGARIEAFAIGDRESYVTYLSTICAELLDENRHLRSLVSSLTQREGEDGL